MCFCTSYELKHVTCPCRHRTSGQQDPASDNEFRETRAKPEGEGGNSSNETATAAKCSGALPKFASSQIGVVVARKCEKESVTTNLQWLVGKIYGSINQGKRRCKEIG